LLMRDQSPTGVPTYHINPFIYNSVLEALKNANILY
jgi:hypothetical protein